MWVTYSQTLYFLFKVRRAWVIKYNRRHLWEQLKLGSSPITTPLQLFFITHARRTLKRKYRVCEQASLQANMWVEFVVGSFPFSERFFSGCSGFPLSPKTNIPNSNSTRNQVGEEPLCGCATSKSLFIYLLYLLKLFS